MQRVETINPIGDEVYIPKGTVNDRGSYNIRRKKQQDKVEKPRGLSR
jgi:hypothetical protein